MNKKPIILLCALLLCSCGSSNSTSENSTSTTSTTRRTKKDVVAYYFENGAFPIGAKCSGDYELVVNNVKKSKYLSSIKTTDNLYIIVNITMTSHKEEEEMVYASSFEVWNEKLINYSSTIDGASLEEKAFLIGETFNYGITLTCAVVFEVPDAPINYLFTFSNDHIVYGFDIGNTETMEEYFK